jgi:hypothetical protein
MRIGREAKDQRKGQWRTENPNDIAQLLDDRSDAFQDLRASAKEGIQAAAIGPESATILIYRIAYKVREPIATASMTDHVDFRDAVAICLASKTRVL